MNMQGMVWLGQSLVMATSLRYVLFNPRTKACTELFSVSPEAPPPTMVQAAPAADEAILLMVRHPCARACACISCVSRHDLPFIQSWMLTMTESSQRYWYNCQW